MEFNSKEPIYIQIVSHVKKRILSGELKGGEKMPSVREFASELKVNPNTIQRVYNELEDSKLIYTQRGIGKFVTDDNESINSLRIESSMELIDGFINNMRELGIQKNDVITIINEKF
ncbi:MAG: GntR family transcriptional regulator [Clostridium sp.]